MTDKTVATWQGLSLQAETLKATKEQLGVLIAALEQRQQEGPERLKTLKRHLDAFDAKTVTLKSQGHDGSLRRGCDIRLRQGGKAGA
jgi:hypothetical protein